MRVETLTDEIYEASEPDPADPVAGGTGQGQPKQKQTELEQLAAKFPPFTKLTELPGDSEVDFVCGHYLARGHTTLMSAKWKLGKTTLIAHILRGFGTGRCVIGDSTRCKVLLCTEESPKIWKRREAELNIGGHVEVTFKPPGRPDQRKWTDFCRFIGLKVAQEGYDVVVIDTLTQFWSCIDENDATKVQDALAPLNYITASGAALLVIHHPKKGDSDGSISARGSGQIGAFYDIGIQMQMIKHATASDRRRVLLAESRFDETPREQVIEWTGDDYRLVGSKAVASRDDRWSVIGDILPTDPAAAMNIDQVRNAWPASSTVACPGDRAFRNDLTLGTEGENAPFACIGAGVKGNPWRYYRRIRAFGSALYTPPCARNESGPGDPVTQNVISHIRSTSFNGSEGKNHG